MRRAELGREEACCRMERSVKRFRDGIGCGTFGRGGVKGDGGNGRSPRQEHRRRGRWWEGEELWFLMCFTVKVQLWKPFRIPLGGPVIWSLPWVRVPPSWFSRSFGAGLLWKTVLVSAALGQEWELPRTQ